MEKANFSSASELILDSLSKMIQRLNEEKARLEKEIDDHIDRHPYLKKDRQLLQCIPCIGRVMSRIMLAVIHGRNFTKASQVVAYIGLIPVQQDSGVFRG